ARASPATRGRWRIWAWCPISISACGWAREPAPRSSFRSRERRPRSTRTWPRSSRPGSTVPREVRDSPMRHTLALAVLALAALTLAVAGPAAALPVRDMLGREVTLPAPPQRIVSLVPSVSEIVFALGADARLVGRTDFCDYPPAVLGKPSVGGMVNPNLE